jgi:hypothetical protein
LVRRSRISFLVLVVAAALAPVGARSQAPQPPDGPEPPPPVRPSPEIGQESPPRPEIARAPSEGPPAKEAPWKLPDELLSRLARAAQLYREHALRFTCIETVRLARYDADSEASEESVRRYAYLLEREGTGETLREYRQKVKDDGMPKGGEVRDEEPFPPAYAWVQLFSLFNQSFFVYRDQGERVDGYDWVREIEFRGALPFTDGKDIRQWEGTVLVDALNLAPIEIHAVPSGQNARVRALYERWSQAFNLIGLRLAPKPLLYEATVRFGLRKEGLRFPTELRYDTRMAVSATQTVPRQASSRTYDGYQFFKTAATETPGGVVGK